MKFGDIKDIPKNPGVYHFLDESGGILYVGKAKNLKNRIKQYFAKELGRGPAIAAMVESAQKIEWTETGSEIEAILLEAEQINRLKPKYNSRQKDDKSFLLIKIARKSRKKEAEDFPCVEVVRYRNADLTDKSAEYFGPYPKGEMLKKSMRYLRRIFPYRDCSISKYNTYRRKRRPCLFGDLGLCSAPCVGRVECEYYWKNLTYLKDFLHGKKKTVVKRLEKEMVLASKAQQFEKAAEIRNKLLALQHLNEVRVGLRDDVFDADSLLFQRIECYDISNLGGGEIVGSMVVFVNGKPDKDEYRKFKIRSLEIGDRGLGNNENQLLAPSPQLPASDLERIEQMLRRRFNNTWDKPDLIVIDGGETHLRVAKKVIAEYNLKIPVISISKGPKRDKNDFHYVDSATAKYFRQNQSLQNIAISSRDEAHRFAITYQRQVHRKNIYE